MKKWPYLSGPKKMGSDKTVWQTPGCDEKYSTPKGKIQNTTYIYGRNGGPTGRKTTKPE